jgi:hypothetical protein
MVALTGGHESLLQAEAESRRARRAAPDGAAELPRVAAEHHRRSRAAQAERNQNLGLERLRR